MGQFIIESYMGREQLKETRKRTTERKKDRRLVLPGLWTDSLVENGAKREGRKRRGKE